MSDPLYIENFSELIDLYNGFIIDLWGVTHDGSALYPGVLDCLKKMKAKGKRIVFLSNAPRRMSVVTQHLDQMGIASDASRTLLTAGEEAFQALTHHTYPYEDFGFSYYAIGPALLESPPFEVVSAVEQASFILNTGFATSEETVADYVTLLKSAFRRKIPMVCANPDRIAFVRDKKCLCAGAIASFYEGLGGVVHYHGKPTSSLYQAAFTWLAPMERSKILAIGDSFETDVQGAFRAGIDVAFVPGGIHREELKVKPGQLPTRALFQSFSQNWPFSPTYVIPGLGC